MPRSRLLFFGTPAFAVPTLRALSADDRFELTAVVTQPDKPAGRGKQLTPPPVKVAAEELGIPVFQPEALRGIQLDSSSQKLIATGKAAESSAGPALVEFINANSPFDAFIVVAYGKIIPEALFKLPRFGAINIHASLLPRWRGAAPIQHALFSGDAVTGVSIMVLEAGLDTGPVYVSAELAIEQHDSCDTLSNRLADLGRETLLAALPEIVSGRRTAVAQEEFGACYAEKWEVEDATIQWGDPAEITERRIRASYPEPGARATFQNEAVKIYRATVVPSRNFSYATPGTIVEVNRAELVVATGEGGFLNVQELQFPGKKRLPIRDILNGRSIKRGDTFT